MQNDRLTSAEAAQTLCMTVQGFYRLAKKRQWPAIEVGPHQTYDRSRIEAEVTDRLKRKQSRMTPAVRAHTEKCAETIRRYWAERGHEIQLEAVGSDIQSDLVNGLPRR